MAGANPVDLGDGTIIGLYLNGDSSMVERMSPKIETALLPCPFCGNSPKLSEHPMGIGNPRYSIDCDVCGITSGRDGAATAGIAIVRWNSRTPHAPAGAQSESRPLRDEDAIIFWYRNYKGEEGYRRVIPISLRFGKTEWHPEDQWLLLGFDTEKKVEREFALADAKNTVGPTKTAFATASSYSVAANPSTASSGDAQLSDPHPHWSADNTNENYPKSLEEWDPHKDPVGEHLARAERRLRIAMDRDDPRAPAEMTLISRWDLTTLVHDWWTKCAVFDMWRAARLEKRGEYDHSPAYPRTRRDEIARIIDPVAFSALERSHIVPQNDEFMGMRIARDKADKILALPYSAEVSPLLATESHSPEPAFNKKSRCPACNLLSPCSEPDCPNVTTRREGEAS